MTEHTSNFELSLDTRTLIERLSKAVVGETVEYLELTGLIGRNIQADARYVLLSALNHCLNDGLVFGTVRKVGVKRLSDIEIVGAGERALPAIRRTSRRAMKRLSQVQDFTAMPREKQQRHNALASALGVIAHFTKEKQVAQITGAIIKEGVRELPVHRTLELFAKK